MEHSVLIIIDVQNDFCPGGNLGVNSGDAIIPVVNALSPQFPLVVATKDWHPAKHISFASQHEGRKPFDQIEINGITQMMWPDHCIKGTFGAELCSSLDQKPINLILHKGVKEDLDSYSAFFENDKQTSTGLAYYLKGLEVETVYLVGLAEDVCVYFSALDSVTSGFTTFIIEDATKGVDTPPGNLEKVRTEMKEKGVRYIHSKEFIH